MSRDLTTELQSIRDGKASIEHQIDIHGNTTFTLIICLYYLSLSLIYILIYRFSKRPFWRQRKQPTIS